MTWTPIHEQLDDAFSLWGKMWRPDRKWVYRLLRKAIVSKKARKRHGSQSTPGLHEKIATGNEWFQLFDVILVHSGFYSMKRTRFDMMSAWTNASRALRSGGVSARPDFCATASSPLAGFRCNTCS